MKTQVIILVTMIALLGLVSTVLADEVSGYFRKDGTYVAPYQRSHPDGNPYNNYGFPGNYNPNTGRITGGSQERYLERYYEPKPPTPYSPYGTSRGNPFDTTPRTRGLGW